MELSPRKAALAAALTLLITVGSHVASADPAVGKAAPDARVEDVDGKSVTVKSLKGKTTLLYYEGKDSAEQNAALKTEIAKLRATEAYKPALRVAAIGDVHEYDYWPVKGIVKDKIREESKARGIPIFCDWDGSFATKMGLRRGVSNVILLSDDGRVLFAYAGAVKGQAKADLLSKLRAEVVGG